MFARFLECEDAATAIEYGLISAIIAVALLSGFAAFSSALNNQFFHLSNTMNDSWK